MKPIDRNELDRRFRYHPPDEAKAERHQQVRDAMRGAANVVTNVTEPSREQSLAITALEEAMYHANAAIAREESVEVVDLGESPS